MEDGFRTVPYGDPTDPSNFQGPQISAPQRERVLGYIEKGVRTGSPGGGGGRTPSHLDKGFYVEPTLIADVDNSMTIAQEEIFGPVLVVIPFDDDDDAVRIANDSQYGLGVRGDLGLGGAGAGCGPADTGRNGHRQRRPLVRRRRTIRRVQGQRHRSPERDRGVRAVHRDQERSPVGCRRCPGELTRAHAQRRRQSIRPPDVNRAWPSTSWAGSVPTWVKRKA